MPSSSATESSVPANLDSKGRGRVRGLEVSIKHEFSEGLFAWLAYTLSRAERRTRAATNTASSITIRPTS